MEVRGAGCCLGWDLGLGLSVPSLAVTLSCSVALPTVRLTSPAVWLLLGCDASDLSRRDLVQDRIQLSYFHRLLV